jgi:hypothetical protein
LLAGEPFPRLGFFWLVVENAHNIGSFRWYLTRGLGRFCRWSRSGRFLRGRQNGMLLGQAHRLPRKMVKWTLSHVFAAYWGYIGILPV